MTHRKRYGIVLSMVLGIASLANAQVQEPRIFMQESGIVTPSWAQTGFDKAVSHLTARRAASMRGRTANAAPAPIAYSLLSSEEDDLGYTHVKVRPIVNGVPVVGQDCIVELRDGQVVDAFGYADTDYSQVDIRPLLNPLQAFRVSSGDLTPLARPAEMQEARLVIFATDERPPTLCWEIPFVTPEPARFNEEYTYYIDARTGVEVYRRPDFCTAQQTAFVDIKTTYYSGVSNLTGIFQNNKYYLKDITRGNVTVESANFQSPDTLYIWGTLWSTTRLFNFTTQPKKAAGDVFFGYQQVWDYFKFKHSRNGWNGSGAGNGILVGWHEYGAAFRSTDKGLLFGSTTQDSTGLPFTTIDIVAHEFTHAVTFATALLGLSGQSGSLDESFSDIFGTATEFYSRQLSNTTTPTLNTLYLANRPPANYLVGEEMGQTIRSLENPPNITSVVDSNPPVSVTHADHYNNRYTGTGDFSGRHVNAGIQNKVFYLLSVGGTHYNVTIASIGREKAERIFYRTLTTKLTSSSNFSAARTGSIASANELYGAGSFESNQVIAAWNSVGVP